MAKFNWRARSVLLAVSLLAITTHSVASADEPARRQALFGDVHVHTGLSFDAYIFGVRRTPDDAYRYALGESIRHANGYDVQLRGGALDFYAVTDHAEYLGALPEMDNPSSPMSLISYARELFSNSLSVITRAFGRIAGSIATGQALPEVDNREVARTVWQEIQASADRYYRPGHFTTFVGYEYTASPDSQNLHRIVLFRGARRPDVPFSAFDSSNPEDLWTWLDANRARGIESIAIPHNSNVSNGLMFELTNRAGGPIDRAYAETRLRNEPIVEISQVKGTSETVPGLSPNDEWAGFENYNILLGTDRVGRTDGSYVRQALQRGLLLEQQTGVNPYQFGFIGSSDTHNAGGPLEEDHYFGKTGLNDGTPEARGTAHVANRATEGLGATPLHRWSAAGLAGVWAERNNREDIFAAMRRRETFATSGPRIRVRMFAGYGYASSMLGGDYAAAAYAGGVPMGSVLNVADRGAPTFLALALKDADSQGLERLQIVKGWIDANGQPQERLYDVACAVGSPDPVTHRCAAVTGSVDSRTCRPNARRGVAELRTLWRDPDFRQGTRAFYYVRALETHSCRWSTWEALRIGQPPLASVPATIQERAWGSPIWVN
jgi:hypothetical protein